MSGYWLRYTHGIRDVSNGESALIPGMEEPGVEYRSHSLFPFLQNRIYNRSRSDLESYRRWIGLEAHELEDPLIELAASGGPRATDSYQLFRVPEPNHGKYWMRFFAHRLRYTAGSETPVRRFDAGEPIYLQVDIQNPKDPDAISLRTGDPKLLIGYVPRFLAPDVRALIGANGAHAITVILLAHNADAPATVRYRCGLETQWPTGFRPFQGEQFEPIETRTTMGVVA